MLHLSWANLAIRLTFAFEMEAEIFLKRFKDIDPEFRQKTLYDESLSTYI